MTKTLTRRRPTSGNRTRDEVAWRLPSELTYAEIEARRAKPVGRGSTLTLDLREFDHCLPTVDLRLLDFLTHLRREGVELRLRIHTAGTGSAELPIRYRRIFSESMGGVILGELAQRVLDENGNDWKLTVAGCIEAQLARRTRGGCGIVWKGSERAAPIYGCEPLYTAAITRAEGPLDARQAMLDELRSLGLKRLRASDAALLHIANCVYQAVDNVHEHAGKLLPDSQPGSRWFGFVGLRRVKHDELKSLVQDHGSRLEHYWRDHREDTLGQHIEITVADNGSGISATMAGNRDVYAESTDFDRELGWLRRAFDRGTSSENSRVGRGSGLPDVLEAIVGCRAAMTVRSGRIEAHAAQVPGRDLPALVQPTELPYPVGTTIVFLVPAPGAREAAS